MNRGFGSVSPPPAPARAAAPRSRRPLSHARPHSPPALGHKHHFLADAGEGLGTWRPTGVVRPVAGELPQPVHHGERPRVGAGGEGPIRCHMVPPGEWFGIRLPAVNEARILRKRIGVKLPPAPREDAHPGARGELLHVAGVRVSPRFAGWAAHTAGPRHAPAWAVPRTSLHFAHPRARRDRITSFSGRPIAVRRKYGTLHTTTPRSSTTTAPQAERVVSWNILPSGAGSASRLAFMDGNLRRDAWRGQSETPVRARRPGYRIRSI